MAWAAATAAPATPSSRPTRRTLDKLMATCPMTWLKAHGTAVGLPTDDDMGNSEVGHNALGCGQIYSQGAKLVQESIESGALFQSKTWKELADNCLQNGKALHFHRPAVRRQRPFQHLAPDRHAEKGRARWASSSVYCHILLDGRDVPATSALEYVDAAGGRAGRPVRTRELRLHASPPAAAVWSSPWTAMRPTGRWSKQGWSTHVQGDGPSVRLRQGSHRDLPRREPRHDRPGSAALRRSPRTASPSPRSPTATASSSSTSAATARRRSPWPSTARTLTSLTAATTPA